MKQRELFLEFPAIHNSFFFRKCSKIERNAKKKLKGA